MELTFDFDNEKFNTALYTLTKCLSNPEISISFAIKDKTKIEEKLLQSAAEDARRKAEILCAASNVKLGKLLSIGFTPEHGTRVLSATEIDSLLSEVVCGGAAPKNMNTRIFIPKDIEETKNIYFSWEILD
ncbi:MAG: SIMPL domain-containing protein [Selenomonadaceae bacterium]|nr:SIMPL domain-containing protein [Selenomonadaceae bacterium]